MSRSNAKPLAERQRQPTEIRRVLLLDAAREVIAARGLAATTMRDIARAGGRLGRHADLSLLRHRGDPATRCSSARWRVFYEPVIDKAREAEPRPGRACRC